jgi:hypothetical protein
MSRELITSVNTRINRFIHKECDFCFRLGHTFNECTDPEMEIMLRNLYIERERIKTDISLSEQHIDIYLYNYILSKANVNSYSLRKWKSFAIRKTGYTDESNLMLNSNSNNSKWMFHIVGYIMSSDMPIEDNDVSDEFIPFNENDAVNYLTNFNDIISNNERDLANDNNNQMDSITNTNRVNEQLGFLILSILQYERMRELSDEKRPINYNNKILLRHAEITCNTNYLNNSLDCEICCESKKSTQFGKYNCNHQFCGDCIEHMLMINQETDNIRCPFCRCEVSQLQTYDEEIFNKIEKYIDSDYVDYYR